MNISGYWFIVWNWSKINSVLPRIVNLSKFDTLDQGLVQLAWTQFHRFRFVDETHTTIMLSSDWLLSRKYSRSLSERILNIFDREHSRAIIIATTVFLLGELTIGWCAIFRF